MTTRRPGTARRATTGGALGLGLALWLGGCALTHDFARGSRQNGHDGAWLGFLSGEDLRAQCDGSLPDAFRLVWHPAGGGFKVLEVIGNEAGGALMLHHAIGARELARSEPPAVPTDPRQRLPLSPDGFGGLIYWFDRLGLFTPVPGAPGQPGAALEWLISGCLSGSQFLNVHLPGGEPDAGGVPVRATPSATATAAPAA